MSDSMKLQGEVSLDSSGAEAALGRVEQAGGRMAAGVSQAAKKAGEDLGKIGDGAGQGSQKLDAGTRSMVASIQRATAAFEAGGKSGAKYFEVLAQQRGLDLGVLKPYIDQLNKAEEAHRKAAGAAAPFNASLKGVGDTAKITAQQLRQVAPQVTDIVTQLAAGQAPLQILIQQGGQLKDVFGGIGPAARALGGYVAGLINPFTVAAAAAAGLVFAYHQGAKESREFANALTFTGNAIGLTGSQYAQLRDNLVGIADTKGKAAEVLTEIAKAGIFTRDSVKGIAEAAILMEKATGQSISKTVDQFKELAKSPAEASAKLNEQYNYLTAAIYKQIKALEDQGRAQEAAALAIKALSDAEAARGKQIIDNIGFIETKFRNLEIAAKKGWDAVFNIGRSETGEEQLKRLRQTLAEREQRGPLNDSAKGAYEKGNEALRQQIALLDRLNGEQTKQTAAEAERQRLQKLGIDFLKQGEQFETKAAKREKEISKARIEGQQLINAGLITEAELQRRISDIREKYKDDAPKKLATNAFDLQTLREYAKTLDDLGAISLASDAKAEQLSKTQAKLREIQASPVWLQYSRQQQEQIVYAASLAQASEDEAAALKKVLEQRELEQRIYYAESGRLAEGLRIAEQQADTLALEVSLIGRSRQERELAIAQRRVELTLAKELARIDTLPVGELDKEALRIEARKKAEIDASNATTRIIVEDWQRASDEISDSLTGAFVDAFENGSDLGKNLAQALKQEFARLVLRPTIQTAINSTGLPQMLGQAVGGGGANLGGLINLFGQGASSMGSLSGGGLLGSIGSSLGLATGAGGSFASTVGAGLATDALGATVAEGAAAATLGGSGALAAIGTAMPYLGAALVVGQALGLFGKSHGPKAESGFGPGVRAGNDPSGAATIAQAIQTQYAQLADALGVSGSALQNLGVFYAKDPNGTAQTQLQIAGGSYSRAALYGGRFENVGRSDTEFQQAVQLASAQLIVKNLQEAAGGQIGDFLRSIDITSASLEQLNSALSTAQDVAIFDRSLTALGSTFDNLRALSVDAQEALIKMAGGVQNLTSELQSYVQNFYSSDEQRAFTVKSIAQALQAAGANATESQIASMTRAQFRAFVESIDVSTEAGRKLYATALQVAGAFASITDAAENSTSGVKSSIDAITSAENVVKDHLSTVKDIFDILGSAVQSLYDQVSSTAGLSARQGRDFIAQALSTAQKTGYLPDAKDLQAAIAAATNGLKPENYTSQFAFDRDRLALAGQLSSLKDVAGEQVTYAQQMLDAANSEVAWLQQIAGGVQGQVAAVTTLAEALSALSAAMAQAKDQATTPPPAPPVLTFVPPPPPPAPPPVAAPPVVPASDPIDPAYLWYFKMVSSDFGEGGGHPMSYQEWLRQQQLWLPSFDVGTMSVPRDMLAFIHKGEKIVPAAYNPDRDSTGLSTISALIGHLEEQQAVITAGWELRAGQESGPSNRELLSELRALRETVHAIGVAQVSAQKEAQRTFDGWDRQGIATRTPA